MSAGKTKRMKLIMPDGYARMNPQDHPVSWWIPGLSHNEIMSKLDNPFISAYIWHKGTAKKLGPYVKDQAVIIHCSAASKYSFIPLDKVTVCSVKEAVNLGADGVSIHVNTHAPNDREQIKALGDITRDAEEYGMPVLAMMYPRGEELIKTYIKDVLEKTPETKKLPSEELRKRAEKEYQYHNDFVMYAARLGAELGADIIKTNYTGNVESFREVVKYCPVPVVIAGGPRKKDKTDVDVLKELHGSLKAGGKGYSFGRNIFQNEQPLRFTAATWLIIYEKMKPEEAWKRAKDPYPLIKKVFERRENEIMGSIPGLK